MSQLSRSKYIKSVGGPDLWNEFSIDSENEIQNLLFFKSGVKSKLHSYENEKSFFNDL